MVKALKLGIIDELYPRIRFDKPSGYWTLEKCKKLAINCKTMKELRSLDSGAHGAVCRNNWSRILFPDMIIKIKWTRKKVFEVAKLCKNRSELRKRYNGAWDMAYRKRWLDILFPTTKRYPKPKGYWTFERCKSLAKKCKKRTDVQKIEEGAYTIMRKNGWLELFFPNTPKTTKWSKEKVFKVSILCKNKKELREIYNGAWDMAYREGWLDELIFRV